MFNLEAVKVVLKAKLEDQDVYVADYEYLKAELEGIIDGVQMENITDLMDVWQWIVNNDLEDKLHESEIYELINDTVRNGLVVTIDRLRKESCAGAVEGVDSLSLK